MPVNIRLDENKTLKCYIGWALSLVGGTPDHRTVGTWLAEII